MESWAFIPKKNFDFWWGLRPRPNLPMPWAGSGQGQKGVQKANKLL